MLENMQLRLAHHVQAASNSFNQLCAKPLATLLTVMVIATALTLPALFWIFTDNLHQLTKSWQQSGHISLYLKSLPANAEEEVLKQVKTIVGQGQVIFKTPAQGLKEIQQQEGMQDILKNLEGNPLPAVIEVIPPANSKTPEIEALYNQLKDLAFVEQAKLDLQWIKKLEAILGYARNIVQVFMVLLGFAVVLIIGNALKLAVQSRFEEIQVLKLIGANYLYIARPFLYSGIWYGLLGAVLAILFVNIFMLVIANAGKTLAETYQMSYPDLGLSFKQAYLIMLVAVLLGWLGARLSVKRQLMLIEP